METNAFAGLTDRELVMAVLLEVKRRSLYGCMFVFPSTGGPSVFASSTPEGTVTGKTCAEQLLIFAEVASMAESEVATKLVDEELPKAKWVN